MVREFMHLALVLVLACADSHAPPTTPMSIDELCSAFRAGGAGPSVRASGEWAGAERQAIDAFDVNPPRIETTTELGLGFPQGLHASNIPPTDAELASVGLDRLAFNRWTASARAAGATRVERWRVLIPDGYHGQPGLLVRTDVAFHVGAEWIVCTEGPTALLPDIPEPIPRAEMTCTATASPVWWTCVASPDVTRALPPVGAP